MSYKRVTIFSRAAVTDEVIEVSKNKYMPAIKAMGALDCEVIQTGPDSTMVIATYADKAAAMRQENQEEFKINEPDVLEGEVTVTM